MSTRGEGRQEDADLERELREARAKARRFVGTSAKVTSYFGLRARGHPGGGVAGSPGGNAARDILLDARKRRSP